jgi:hypothetical protein
MYSLRATKMINTTTSYRNYRIMKRKNKAGEYEYGIYEVYYSGNGDIIGATENTLTSVCASKEELLDELNSMMTAFERETLLHE